jgi:hypothetical protein
VLGHIVAGVLLEQGQGEREVDHESCRERAGLLVPDAAVIKRLCDKLRGHPPGHRPQPDMIGQGHPRMHADSNDYTTATSP